MMLRPLIRYIHENDLLQPTDKVILAVSGGIDSIVLADLFFKAEIDFAIAHCNFHLREEESEADETFIRTLATRYQTETFIKSFETIKHANTNKISIQMAARELRYLWFEELLIQHSYDHIATAHQQSDVLETVILNLSRGTGIAGLHGIASKKGKIIRPLLFANKTEIIRYAIDNALPWREDSSNTSNKYYRNLIRNKVIPVLKNINPNIEKATAETVRRLGQIEMVFMEKAEAIKKQALTTHNNVIYISTEAFKHELAQESLLFECIKDFGFIWSDVRPIVASLEHTGKRFLSKSHELVIDRKQLVITQINHPTAGLGIIKENDQSYKDQDVSISLQQVSIENYHISNNIEVAAIDMDKLVFPLKIRRWKSGDRFQPLGMTGRKMVSDFLIDKKVPLNLKNSVRVLLSAEQIVWVVGWRLDDRFKINTQTTNVLEVTLQLPS